MSLPPNRVRLDASFEGTHAGHQLLKLNTHFVEHNSWRYTHPWVPTPVTRRGLPPAAAADIIQTLQPQLSHILT